jgi:hypothetical protein
MNDESVRHGAYVAYMLRLWRAGSRAGQPIWRASLENPHTGERLAFGDAKELFAFLAELMARPADMSDPLEKVERNNDDDKYGLSSVGSDSTASL